ncbi:hypothetical protein ACI2K4_29245 [Micromonospora sp. NPDC050397]|uniref:hypothetical protein n=1 Tax=Micromonospora sp. NPDC050397 TaxID=3364279 RepID=UPI00384CBCA0
METAKRKAVQGLADAAHVLNKAALIASDVGMPYLARQLCWHHIDAYRRLRRPLTLLEARYMLEPVLNLARLQIRADQGTAAVRVLEAMHRAVTGRSVMTIEGKALPTADLVGEQHERRQLREWVWLQLVGEGVRAYAFAGRWADAAEHARIYNGIGVHLMEGRQAAIISHCVRGDLLRGRALLARSTSTEPWEQDVAACLRMIATEAGDALLQNHLATAIARFTGRPPIAGYASYRARLGLTIATLAGPLRPEQASEFLRRIAEEAGNAADGYAARDVLGFREPIDGITEQQRRRLSQLKAASGLGIGTLPESTLSRLNSATNDAVAVLDLALQSPAGGRRGE